MCRTVCNGECATGAFTVTDVVYAVGAGLWWTAKRVVAPVALVTGIAAWRWFSGAPLVGEGRPWRLPRVLARIRWWAWPRWQRALVRTVAAVIVALAVIWPAATILTVAATAASVTAAAALTRRRNAARQDAVAVEGRATHPAIESAPIRVDSILGANVTAGQR